MKVSKDVRQAIAASILPVAEQNQFLLTVALGCPCGLQYPNARIPPEVLARIKPGSPSPIKGEGQGEGDVP